MPQFHFPKHSLDEEGYRKLAVDTVTREALFNGQDYPQALLRGRYDPWVDFDDSSPVTGSVNVLQLPSNQKAIITEHTSPESLRGYFASENSKTCGGRRRLFILEGLDARFLEVLGTRLCIHPSVFIAHSTDPGLLDITDMDGFLPNPSQYWVVMVQQLHRLSDGFYENPGIYLNDKIKPKRLAGRFVRRNPPLSFTSHLVTFWSHSYDHESWDVMLIVDPLFRPTVYKPVGQPGLISIDGREGFTISEDLRLLPRVPRVNVDCSFGDSPEQIGQPQTTPHSIKDRLIKLYLNHDHAATSDPASAAWYCQGIIFSMWTATVRALEERYMQLWDTNIFAWHHDVNAKFRVEEYQNFSSQQLVARRFKKDYLDICRRMGINIDLNSDPTACTSKGRSWKWLLERLNILEEQINDMMTMSTQRVSVEESINANRQTEAANAQARSANEQAQSVGWLTAFAAILVPFTVVSGIFSMGGVYAVGEPKFWCFWAVALPVTCVVIICLFCLQSAVHSLALWRTFVKGAWRKWRIQLKSRPEKEGKMTSSKADPV